MSDALLHDPGLTARWRDAVDLHKAHAASEWPREAVGLIDGGGKYRPCTNVAVDPVGYFEIANSELFSVDNGNPAALLHSHTAVPDPVTGKTTQPMPCPSAADMQAQMSMAIPWGISLCIEGGATDPIWFGDQVERPPLYGRTFIHGVNDCYAWIRDWYREVAGIRLKDFARDLDWWEPAEQDKVANLYMDGFEEAGFVHVQRPYSPLPGDVFLCKVRSPVINHGGVYLGDGMIAHHLMGQLSVRTAASIWRPKLDFLVRHRDLPEDWKPEK